MIKEILFFVLASILSVGVIFALYQLINGFLKTLLTELVGMPSATSFYSRLLLVCLVLIGLAGISDAAFDLEPEAEFMEYIWSIVDFFEEVLTPLLVILGLFLVLVTVLVAALRPRREQ